jgi:hypothetical protein
MAERPLTREDELDMLVDAGMSRAGAESFFAELDDGASTVTEEERQARIADLYARRPDLKPDDQ